MSADRKAHRHLLAPVREALETELRALRAAYGGSLPTALIAQFAIENDVSVRTVQRMAADPTAIPAPRSRFVITDEHLAHVAAGPNRFQAWRRCVDAGICSVGYEQFTRALNTQVDPAVLAGALYGLSAMTGKQAFALRESDARNDMWIIDHYEVPVYVHWPGYRLPVKPWQTTLIDDRHRTVMGAVWWPKAPTATEAIAAVAAAVRGTTLPEGSFLGGSPKVLMMDQGAELIGGEATAAYLSMRIDPQPAPARAPWVKGKLETFHHNVLDAAFAAFPGWTGGPTDTAGRQMLATPLSELLDRDTFRQRAWAVIAEYNAGHAHSALGGATPLESWLADAAEIRVLPDAIGRQHWLTLRRKVSGKGVQLHNLHYQDGRLGHDGGRTLEVRYLPDDLTFVDVLRENGEWVHCAAQPLPPRATDELLRIRAQQNRHVRRLLRRARQVNAEAHAEARSAPPAPAPAPAPAPVPAPASDSADAADQHAPAVDSLPWPQPQPVTAPVSQSAPPREPRRSTNTRGGGPTSMTTPPPTSQPTPAEHRSRMRPRRIVGPDQDGAS